MIAPVDVLAVMGRAIEKLTDPAGGEHYTPGMICARAAVAELIACNAATVKAFEALGRTDNIVAQLESHRECERALVEQKAALARVQGGAA